MKKLCLNKGVENCPRKTSCVICSKGYGYVAQKRARQQGVEKFKRFDLISFPCPCCGEQTGCDCTFAKYYNV